MDMRFKNEVKKIPGGERMMMCFQCGTCTADCPIARFSDSYRPRQILRMAQLGLKDRVLSSEQLWLCAACYTCVDHCPQDVEISSVIRALRNIAVQEGYMPPVFKELAAAIQETGLAYKIPELRLKRRQEVGLPPLPKASLKSVSELFNQTGFSKLMKNGGNNNAKP
jgi:heterodisulfide reductase subunit C